MQQQGQPTGPMGFANFPTGPQPNNSMNMLKAAEAAAAPRKYNKKRKMMDTRAPEKVSNVIPESQLFNRLLEMNKGIDEQLQAKKSDIKEVVTHAHLQNRVKKQLRLYIYNTHAHQHPVPGQPPEPASWMLCLNGRVTDMETIMNGNNPAAMAAQQQQGPFPASSPRHNHPMTYYLRRVEIQLDTEQYPGADGLIVWEKAKSPGGFKDSLEVRRMGSRDVKASIKIWLDWQPERYVLPGPLAEVLGVQYETRARILHLLWNYIKRFRLQDPKQPHLLNLTPELAQVFGAEQVNMTAISIMLTTALQPMPPVTMDYTIKVAGPSPSHPDCYDMITEVPSFHPHDKLVAFLDKLAKDREIEMYDQKIAGLVRKINEHRRRRAFYLGFSQAPVDFINALIASQARDLRVAHTINGQNYELERRTEVFSQKWVEDAVMKYLHRKMAAGH